MESFPAYHGYAYEKEKKDTFFAHLWREKLNKRRGAYSSKYGIHVENIRRETSNNRGRRLKAFSSVECNKLQSDMPDQQKFDVISADVNNTDITLFFGLVMCVTRQMGDSEPDCL